MLAALVRIAGREPRHWLVPGHQAKDGQLPRSWKRIAGIPHDRLVDAVAMGVPTHCADGWAYASRALAAVLAGDGHAARHMAYYGQLRAGLCILANVGVGVFNGVNFVILPNGSVARLDPPTGSGGKDRGLGTHEIVWLALQQWAANPATAAVFLDLVKIAGTSLRDGLESLWPGFASTTAAGTIVEAWGLDLKRGKDEHRARNISSYAPQALNPLSMSTGQNLRFVAGTWRLFEPSVGAGFDRLDRQLLRSVLWRQHILSDPGLPLAVGPVASRYEELAPAIQQIASKDFLLGVTEPTRPELIRKAESKANPAGPLSMIARALLLLRAATAFTHSSLEEAGLKCSAGVLRPWLNELAAARGFWPHASPFDQVSDLWADVEVALHDLDSSRKPVPPNLYDWFEKLTVGLPTISQAERIAVWSLAG